MIKEFNPHSAHPQRAQQAWQILVGVAKSRQTITYQHLALAMYRREAAGVLDKILGHVAFYCKGNEIPVLTSIVVGTGRGSPGDDIPLDLMSVDEEREKVYDYDWYNVYPPVRKSCVRLTFRVLLLLDPFVLTVSV
jgi:hypothetical protein